MLSNRLVNHYHDCSSNKSRTHKWLGVCIAISGYLWLVSLAFSGGVVWFRSFYFPSVYSQPLNTAQSSARVYCSVQSFCIQCGDAVEGTCLTACFQFLIGGIHRPGLCCCFVFIVIFFFFSYSCPVWISFLFFSYTICILLIKFEPRDLLVNNCTNLYQELYMVIAPGIFYIGYFFFNWDL